MSQIKIQEGFEILQQSVGILQKALATSFFDAYIETLENIVDNLQVRIMDDKPNREDTERLEKLYKKFTDLKLSDEEYRKVTQLVLLSGLKREPVQANHQLTPDALGFLFGYLAEQLLSSDKNQPIEIMDLTVGTGNLLYTVMLFIKNHYTKLHGVGVEVDDTLLAIASVNAALMNQNVTLYHQDSIQNLLIDPVDLAISDLPIGYYPDDEKAKQFMVGVEGEHTYAHHLLVEQSMNYVKEEGYGIFLVPEDFMVSAQGPAIKEWLNSKVYLQAILGLPDSLFQSKNSRKSIIVVQNRGGNSHQAKEVLLAKVPSLKDSVAVQGFFEEFRNWRVNNI